MKSAQEHRLQRGLTVRPLRRSTADPLEIGVQRSQKAGCQHELTASEVMPGPRSAGHGTRLS
jgi:hypothetical protein